jgi:hypothetical protein
MWACGSGPLCFHATLPTNSGTAWHLACVRLQVSPRRPPQASRARNHIPHAHVTTDHTHTRALASPTRATAGVAHTRDRTPHTRVRPQTSHARGHIPHTHAQPQASLTHATAQNTRACDHALHACNHNTRTRDAWARTRIRPQTSHAQSLVSPHEHDHWRRTNARNLTIRTRARDRRRRTHAQPQASQAPGTMHRTCACDHMPRSHATIGRRHEHDHRHRTHARNVTIHMRARDRMRHTHTQPQALHARATTGLSSAWYHALPMRM